MHTSGSGYSLPSMLNTASSGGSGSSPNRNGITPSTSQHGHAPVMSASSSSNTLNYNNNRRRSRAFSIESASTYDKIDLSNPETPLTAQSGSMLSKQQAQQQQQQMQQRYANASTGQIMSQLAKPFKSKSKADDEEALFLPAGAAPYPDRAIHASKNQNTIPPSSSSEAGYGAYTKNGYGYHPENMGAKDGQRMNVTKYHKQIPSGSSFGSMDGYNNNRELTAEDQQEYGYAYTGIATSSPPRTRSQSQSHSPQHIYRNAQPNVSPTREMLVPPLLIKTDSKQTVRSPFDDADDYEGEGGEGTRDPMPHSPTLIPTQLSRKTTDPFSNKKSLRVINPDEFGSEKGLDSPTTPTPHTAGIMQQQQSMQQQQTEAMAVPRLNTTANATNNNQEVGRPFSNWSSIAPSRASTGTMSDAYSTFHFDTAFGSGGGGGNHGNMTGGGRISRADSLDAGRILAPSAANHNHKRSSSAMEFVPQEGEILTPRQVNNVGFFRDP